MSPALRAWRALTNEERRLAITRYIWEADEAMRETKYRDQTNGEVVKLHAEAKALRAAAKLLRSLAKAKPRKVGAS